jgi:ADP-ribose pyrophosphatase YjhB (NUDIX family)
MKRADPQSIFWVIPGGGIKHGEYSRDAAVRKVKEETGLNVRIERLLWVVEEKLSDGSINFCHYFLAYIAGGELIKGYDPELHADSQVILDVGFVSKEELRGLSRVYPEAILEEFWKLNDSKMGYDPWRCRPSIGFGFRNKIYSRKKNHEVNQTELPMIRQCPRQEYPVVLFLLPWIEAHKPKSET